MTLTTNPFVYGDDGAGLSLANGQGFYIPTVPSSEEAKEYRKLSTTEGMIPGGLVLAYAREAAFLARPDVRYEDLLTPGIARGEFTREQLGELKALCLQGALRCATATVHGNAGDLITDSIVSGHPHADTREVIGWLRMASIVEERLGIVDLDRASLPERSQR
jgi:hypothetical protein